MNLDISSLRAELKSFEREFKASHDRVPSVDDIKSAGFGTTRTILIPEAHLWLITTSYCSR